MQFRVVFFCFLLTGPQVLTGAAHALAQGYAPMALREHTQATARSCAVTGSRVTVQEMRAAVNIIRERLRSVFGAGAGAALLENRCIQITVPPGTNQRGLVEQVMAIGAVVFADSGKSYLDPGTHVQLVAGAHRTNLRSRLPSLRIVLTVSSFRRRSAHVELGQSDSPSVIYSLTSRASSAWCVFTRQHLHGFTAIVLDGSVLADPMILEPVCGGPGKVSGITSAAQAKMIAAYLNFGPLPVALQQA